ncbi:MAG TPA: hypothetical protein VD735_00055 [Candidatus Saccharimonadales bacterium]|nr:hypothetical protein [Candidatus Saccharimonadales bacterium]
MSIEHTNHQPPLRVETKEEAYARLAALPVYHDVPAGLEYAEHYIVAYPTRTRIDWGARQYHPGDEYRYADPNANDRHKEVYDMGVEGHKGQLSQYYNILTDDGFWWRNSPRAMNAIDRSLRQVHRVVATEHETGRRSSIDVMNCTKDDLTAEEEHRLERTMQAVSVFTRGKIFSRMAGIVLSSKETFGLDDPTAAGDFNNFSGIMHLNMDKLRALDEVTAGRYKAYFGADSDLSAFEIATAHEAGHGMDLRSAEEVRARLMDPYVYAEEPMPNGATGAFSYFDSLPGWTREVAEVNGKQKDVWRFNEIEAVEYGELPPTNYACTRPSEDVPESFAIAALGGDTSALRQRAKIVGEMVDQAQGRVLGEHVVALGLVQPENGVYIPRRLQAIKLHVGVPIQQ